ncbi:4Fe-4S binding protein [Shewanella fidelis]|uniref:4Fe-4S binding protein n=1 Tax=Shewanella fidelis TaxID=173509 RepID=A0AAW8NWA3_9GAMM|nr:4Fe-4S binding protein [Shewanella fidelis]MDR8525753.1 4Fe-4S binding protein [Shewanella fidelis]MDW4812738.1 4Fe-4S binding protein [Shewanella fidelis]MDW4816486.1 4Fe-4S binding protein [Shewanella fidelis]MDW4820350.1 4Fe-4S binding protein [Shewanella fidelis]MDW4825202.1 4Fe-4S binding protein [Shewanella fidelis]
MSNSETQVGLKEVRQKVLAGTQVIQNLIPPTVSYTTEGNVLVIGPEDLARLAADKLSNMGKCAILANEPITSQDEEHLEKVMTAAENVESYYNKLIEIKGFLGQFQVKVEHESGSAELSTVAIRKAHFDLILDLSMSPCINLEMLPPGYFYVGQDQAKLDDALEQLPDLIGSFDKPRYVKVNSDLCAHNRNGNEGCTRCLNFCPADAIASVQKKIEIDPYLCHGAGSCTNACPTGAISYDLPTPQAMHTYLQKLVTSFRSQAQTAPVILFHDMGKGAQLVTEALAGEVIPVELEEITVASMDHWMSALAWGARQILVLQTDATAPTLTQMLQGELSLANAILDEMGQPQRISLITEAHLTEVGAKELSELLITSASWPVIVPAEFAATTKRETIYNAIDHLNEQAASVDTCLSQSNIPYGQVSVNTDNCTLCMSCVATCPTMALTDGGDRPALHFVEQDCVQCGLCEAACPEKVISLTPQVNFDKAARQARQTLHEEAPFECITCGTPFATQSMVKRMLDVVGTHSAFSANTDRLKMCGDCRVKDMFEDILQDPEKQLR